MKSLNRLNVAWVLDVPPRVTALIRELHHPVRLPILIALSDGAELSAAELRQRSGAKTFSVVNNALKQLMKAGYVEVARVEVLDSGPGNTTQRLYRGGGEDWPRLVAILDEYARDV